MTKSTKQRLLEHEDSGDDHCVSLSSSKSTRRSLSRGMSQRMPSMKKLTSIRNLMGAAPQGATLLEDVEELSDSFNISFRDLNKSLDDTCLDKLAKNQDFEELKSGKGLQFHPDHGLQFDPMLESKEEEEEEDLLFMQDNSRKSLGSSRRHRRRDMTSRKSLRRTSSRDGTEESGSGIRRSSTSESIGRSSRRPRRSGSGDGSTGSSASSSRRTSERSKRRSSTSTTERRSSRSRSKDTEIPVVEESTEEESSSSLEATPEEAPLDVSNRRSSTRGSIGGPRSRMMHRAESVRGGGKLGSFSDQGRSTRRLEASKRDRPSIRVSRATKDKEKDARRSSERRASAAMVREPSRRVINLADKAKETKGAGLQW